MKDAVLIVVGVIVYTFVFISICDAAGGECYEGKRFVLSIY